MRGTFKPSCTGCEVDYRIEFIPMMLWVLVLSYAVGIPVVIAAVWLGYIPVSVIAWLIAITAIVLPLNVWFSERQAAWLKEYIDSVLDLRPIGF
jgi:hypothetical protein